MHYVLNIINRLCSAKSNQEIGRQVMERSRKRKQNRPSKFTASSLPQSCKTVTSGLGSPTKKIRKVGEDGDRDSVNATEILFLLEKKKKLVKKDGLYKFVSIDKLVNLIRKYGQCVTHCSNSTSRFFGERLYERRRIKCAYHPDSQLCCQH